MSMTRIRLEKAAKAHLTAAAPDLLEACEQLIRDAEGYAATHGAGRAATKRIEARCDKAREAIAKARGWAGTKSVTCPACGAIGRIPVDCEIVMCTFGQHRIEPRG